MSQLIRNIKKPFITVGYERADYIVDGVADDVQIQAAIDYVNANGGGVVFLKSGSYNIVSVVITKSNVSLVGAGVGATILTGNTTDYNLVKTTKSGTTKTVYTNITLRNLTFKSNYGSCLVINNTNGVIIEGCEFTFTVTTPIRQTLFTQHCQNVTIKNNNAHDYTGNGLSVTATDYFVIQGNVITGGANGDDGIDVDYDFLDTSAIASNYGTVVGNTVRAIGRGNGIRVENSNYVTTGNNTVDGVTTTSGITAGILINTSTTNTGTGNTVTGNVVSNCTSAGVAIDGTNLTNNIVNSNTIYNCGANSGTNPRGGIILNATGVICTSNLIDTTLKTGSDGAGILIYKKNNHLISNNKIRNSVNGIQAWNGDALQSYTGVQIVYNDVSDNNTNPLVVPAVTAGVIRANFGASNTVLGDLEVPDEVYGVAWNGSLEVPTKNAIYDKLETIASDVLFDRFADVGNVGTGEDDLYSDTIAASQLSANGQKITATYQGIFSGAVASTQELRMYFGGTLIYDSGALSIGVATNSWTAEVVVIRESSSVVRCSVAISTDFATLFPYSKYTRITGLTLTNTQIIKLTGEAAGAGAANDQVVAKLGYVEFKPSA